MLNIITIVLFLVILSGLGSAFWNKYAIEKIDDKQDNTADNLQKQVDILEGTKPAGATDEKEETTPASTGDTVTYNAKLQMTTAANKTKDVATVSFKHPSSWDAIFSTQAPEGGAGNERIDFSVAYDKKGAGVKAYNDAHIQFFWSLSEDKDQQKSFLDDVYKSNCPGDNVDEAKKKTVKVGNKNADAWENKGGLNINQSTYCVKTDTYLTVITRDKDTLRPNVTDKEFQTLLSSFVFE